LKWEFLIDALLEEKEQGKMSLMASPQPAIILSI